MTRFLTRACVAPTLISAVLFSAPAAAASILDLSVEERQQAPVAQRIYVGAGKLRINDIDGRGGDIVFDRAREAVTVVDNAKRSYFVIDEEQLGRVVTQAQGVMNVIQEQLAKQMENLSPEQQAQLKEMMGGFGGAAAPAAAPATYTATPRTGKYAGHACRVWQVVREQSALSEVCVAPRDALGIDADDRDTLLAMQSFAAGMLEQIGSLLGAAAGGLPRLGDGPIDGIAIAVADLQTGTKAMLTGISRADLPAEHFSVPADYTRQAMPMLGL